jgi:H+/Cl- antiporter ClcA
MNIYTEALVIGLVIGIIGTPLSYLAMRVERKYVGLSTASWVRIFLIFVISGALAHLLFEASGINKKYCETGVACRKLQN